MSADTQKITRSPARGINHGSYVNTKEPWFYKETLVKIG